MGKLPVYTLMILSLIFFSISCGGKKTVKQSPYEVQQEKARKAFEELEEESEKPVEQLKLPLEDQKKKL